MEKPRTSNPPAALIDEWWTPEGLARLEEKLAQRRAETVEQIKRTYHDAVVLLGQKEADSVWKKVAAKRDGRPQKRWPSASDRELVRGYLEARAAKDPPLTVASYVDGIDKEALKKYGNSPEAVKTQLRRLLKRREAVLREQLEL